MSDMHIPGGPVEFQFQQRATIVMGEFVPESRLTDQEILAAEQTGSLIPWRQDATGQWWFRRATGADVLQPIHADRPPEFCEVEMIGDDADDS